MKKTVNINLSGQIFHADEDAYEKLQDYLASLQTHFSNQVGREEIITDIEARLAEMFSQRLGSGRQVITLKDVDEAMATMGRPEQMDDSTKEPVMPRPPRRLFRNPDDRIIGGVCSGISAYFGWDPIWLRLAFVVAVIGFGSGILLYLILWLIIPEARTASDKLLMRGEPVTVSSIEKNIREELEALKKSGRAQMDRLKHSGTRDSSVITQLLSFFSELIRNLGRVLAVLLGIFLLFAALVTLATLMALIASMFGEAIMILPFNTPELLMPEINSFLLALVIILVIGVPAVFLLLLSLKLLFKTQINLNRALIISLVLWILAIGLAAYLSSEVYRSLRFQAEHHERITLTSPDNTLYVQVEQLWKDFDQAHSDEQIIKYDLFPFRSYGENIIPLVKVYLNRSDNDTAYLNLTRISKGKSLQHAFDYARAITYSYKTRDSILILPNGFVLNPKTPFRGQRINVTLSVPDGWTIKFHPSVEHLWIESDIWLSGKKEDLAGHTWQVRGYGLHCLDCSF
ncbi:MAG: PspC domain-containing protein [Chitinophagales bacterium]|nr:PspC domain-containing protein [Chitinophagales bacterium]MDW8428876.1 PspC domain-containing protein [Chitinophagales bacterium]